MTDPAVSEPALARLEQRMRRIVAARDVRPSNDGIDPNAMNG